MESTTFICGCGHSGTSLLLAMLAAHPDVFAPRIETNVFALDDDAALARLEQIRRKGKAAGKRYLVEKTPGHIRRLEKIRRLVPGSRMIVPVRDGRDVTASMATRHGDRGSSVAVRRWIADNSIVAAEQDSEDVLVYRHEDLVGAPPGILARICEFAAIPFDASMLDYHRQDRYWFAQREIRRPTQNEHRALRNWQVNQPIFDNSGRWRTELQETDIEPLLTGPGGELMRRFGYLE